MFNVKLVKGKKLKTNADLVKDFMLFNEQPILNKPGIPNERIIRLGYKLIEEEFNEFKDAKNIIEKADAIGDLIYVCYWNAHAYGLPIDKIIAEIQASNMSKSGADGKPVTRADGKILKGPNFFEPNIKAILEECV